MHAPVDVHPIIHGLFGTIPSKKGPGNLTPKIAVHYCPIIFGSHLGTLALKTENFSKKSVVLVKRENGFTKTLFSLFSRVFCPRDGFSKSIFAFY